MQFLSYIPKLQTRYRRSFWPESSEQTNFAMLLIPYKNNNKLVLKTAKNYVYRG